MEMTNMADQFEFSEPDSESLLEIWLAANIDRSAEPKPAPDVSQMIRYLSRTLSSQAMIDIDEGLAAHPEACEQLEQVLVQLDELQRLTCAEVSKRAEGDGLASQVARAWLSLASERLQAAPRAREYWLAQGGWSAVSRHVVEGVAEAQVAWSAVLAFGRQLTAALSQPRMAQARAGSTEPATDGDLPDGVKLVVT